MPKLPSLALVPVVVVACSSSGVQLQPAPAPGPPPAWVDGCEKTVERRDGRRLLVGVACMDDEYLTSVELRTSTTWRRALAEAAKLNDLFVATLMSGYETEELAFNMRKVALIVENSREFSAGDASWEAADGTIVCSRMEFDLQRDLLDRLDGAGLEERLVSHVRAHAIATYDALGPEVECEPARPR